jgi:hypothetical protein
MAAMDDLIAFLRARLDEDEQAAAWAVRDASVRERGLGEDWEAVRTGLEMRELVIQTKPKASRPHRVIGGLDPLLDETVAAHVVRHNPDRVLHEVEAKRQLLHAHMRDHECISLLDQGEHSVVDDRPWEYWEAKDTAKHGPCLVVRLIALPYSDHPDYREEWKP